MEIDENGAGSKSSIKSDNQNTLWAVKSELTGLGFLFRNIESCEISGEEAAGIGLSLEGLAERVSLVLENL